MIQISTIEGYCKEINIPPPKHPLFDIRRFEDNMKTVHSKQRPFRHELYAIALRHEGGNIEVNGKPLSASVFFNSPYQVITWNILPDWKGWYIIFSREFISMNPGWGNFIVDYPFFRLDKYVAFNLPEDVHLEADGYYKKIFQEYHSSNIDKFTFIQAFTQLLLNTARRYFGQMDIENYSTENARTADIILVSKFQSLIETLSSKEEFDAQVRQPSFYANQLNIHPNYLNAVVKRITDKTASQLIQQHLTSFAKSLLKQTGLSIKEVAYRLHFNEPTHFNAFFKKHTQFTPQQYRENVLL